MATIRALCVTPRLAIRDVACRSARSLRGALRGGESTHVVFVRHGAFAMHIGGRDYIADPLRGTEDGTPFAEHFRYADVFSSATAAGRWSTRR